MMLSRDFFISTAEQVGFAYLGALITLIGSDTTGVIHLSVLESAAVAAVPAALAALKAAIAHNFGDPKSANFKN